MRLQRQHGFTLIELLVVIAIIGILSSVVLASLNSARKKGRDARRISDVKQIQLALELYYDGSGSNEYPEEESSRVPSALAPTYISTIPVDPQTGVGYDYNNLTAGDAGCNAASAVCPSYVLGAHIEGVMPEGDIDGQISGAVFSCADSEAGAVQHEYCVRP
ncbi:MAG: hypothetical protein A2854_03750 [Parcubacteria group bacterium RIFCSPHIGHO2_01_FULL_56_18]|nr:MAG: hypothetical protein A2854_03750 [Parcubacteria group bacterium RIFCSPHIGHO2_01_FULL_56_18]